MVRKNKKGNIEKFDIVDVKAHKKSIVFMFLVLALFTLPLVMVFKDPSITGFTVLGNESLLNESVEEMVLGINDSGLDENVTLEGNVIENISVFPADNVSLDENIS